MDEQIFGELLTVVIVIISTGAIAGMLFLLVLAWASFVKMPRNNERVIDRFDRVASLMHSPPSRSLSQAKVRGVRRYAQRQGETKARATVEKVRNFKQRVREKEMEDIHDPSQ